MPRNLHRRTAVGGGGLHFSNACGEYVLCLESRITRLFLRAPSPSVEHTNVTGSLTIVVGVVGGPAKQVLFLKSQAPTLIRLTSPLVTQCHMLYIKIDNVDILVHTQV